MMNKVVYIKRE